VGSFYCDGKNGFYWDQVGTLAPNAVDTTDARIVPWRADGLDYMALWPQYAPTGGTPTVLTLWIGGQQVGAAYVGPKGLFHVRVVPPVLRFNLETRDSTGTQVLKTEQFVAKRLAFIHSLKSMLLEQREAGLRTIALNQNWETIQPEYVSTDAAAIIGILPTPPPGWPLQLYRDCVLGDGYALDPNGGGVRPGLRYAARYGGSQKGLAWAIQSVTGKAVTFSPAFGGKQWLIRSPENSPNPATPGPDSWYLLNNGTPTPPGANRIRLLDRDHMARTQLIMVPGSQRTVSQQVQKSSNSYIQSANPGDYPFLPETTLSLTIGSQAVDVRFGPLTTTADQAAADILLQNPALNNSAAVYASNGYLRIGTAPIDGETVTITILGGTALSVLGYTLGQSVMVSQDALWNPNILGPLTASWNAITYIEGTDYIVDAVNGVLVWAPSTAANNLPPQGAAVNVSYTYVMRREITAVAKAVVEAGIHLVFDFQP
jgi:hypothetical protein